MRLITIYDKPSQTLKYLMDDKMKKYVSINKEKY